MKPIYFKTREEAEKIYLEHIDKTYPNKFQDAMAIARIKIVEFKKGFAIQFGDYGPYLQTKVEDEYCLGDKRYYANEVTA